MTGPLEGDIGAGGALGAAGAGTGAEGVGWGAAAPAGAKGAATCVMPGLGATATGAGGGL